MKKFILNGKEYEINEKITFGTICDMEEADVDLSALVSGKKTFSQIRNLVAYFTGLDKEEAANEVQKHLDNGGELKDLSVLFEVLGNSDFFQKLVAAQNEEN